MFAVGGLMKLGGAHSMVHMFGQIGAGQWFRYLIGSFEIPGAPGRCGYRLVRQATCL